MPKIFKISLFAAALVVTPVVSYASQGPPNQTEMAPLQYLVGTWNCEWRSGTHSGNEQQVFEPALDGTWLQEKEVVNDQGRELVRSIHYTGYNPTTKMFVHVGPDADGTFELAQSPDTVNWHSADGSFIHHKVSDTERTMTETDGGQALSMTCRKM